MATLHLIISGLVYFHREAETLWIFCLAPPVKPEGLGAGVHPHRTRLYLLPEIETAGHWPARKEFGTVEMSELVDDVRKPFGGSLWGRHYIDLVGRDLSLEGFKQGDLDYNHKQRHRRFDKVASIGQFLSIRDITAKIDQGLLAEPYSSNCSVAARLKIKGLAGQVSTLFLWGPHAQDEVVKSYISDYPPETVHFEQEMAHSVLITLSFDDEAMLMSRLQCTGDDEQATVSFSKDQGASQSIFLIADYRKHDHQSDHQPDNNHFLAYYDLFQKIPVTQRNALLRPRRSDPCIIGDSTCSPAQGP